MSKMYIEYMYIIIFMSKMYIEYMYIIIYIWQLFPRTWRRYRIILCGARLLPSHCMTRNNAGCDEADDVATETAEVRG